MPYTACNALPQVRRCHDIQHLQPQFCHLKVTIMIYKASVEFRNICTAQVGESSKTSNMGMEHLRQKESRVNSCDFF